MSNHLFKLFTTVIGTTKLVFPNLGNPTNDIKWVFWNYYGMGYLGRNSSYCLVKNAQALLFGCLLLYSFVGFVF